MKRTSTLVPQLRFKEFESADPWEVKKLGEVCDVIAGQSPEGRYYNTSHIGMPFYQGRSEFGYIYLNLPKFWTSKITKVGKANTIVMSVRAPVGDINMTTEDICIGRGLCSINPKVNKWFIFYTLIASNNIKGNGGSIFDSINLNQIINIPIPLPRLAEQEKIATVLCSMDRLLELETQKLQHLEEHKKGLLQKLFPAEGQTVPQLRFKEFESADPWEVKKLGEVCELLKGEQLNKNTLSENGDYPVINGGMQPSGFTNKFNREAFTITISEGGNSCGFINFISSNFWSGGHCYTLNNIKTPYNKGYIYFSLKYHEKQIMKLRVGSGLPNIQRKSLIEYCLPIPRLAEQEKIAAVLSIADQHITQQKQKVQALKQQKQYLLQNLFPQEVE